MLLKAATGAFTWYSAPRLCPDGLSRVLLALLSPPSSGQRSPPVFISSVSLLLGMCSQWWFLFFKGSCCTVKLHSHLCCLTSVCSTGNVDKSLHIPCLFWKKKKKKKCMSVWKFNNVVMLMLQCIYWGRGNCPQLLCHLKAMAMKLYYLNLWGVLLLFLAKP